MGAIPRRPILGDFLNYVTSQACAYHFLTTNSRTNASSISVNDCSVTTARWGSLTLSVSVARAPLGTLRDLDAAPAGMNSSGIQASSRRGLGLDPTQSMAGTRRPVVAGWLESGPRTGWRHAGVRIVKGQLTAVQLLVARPNAAAVRHWIQPTALARQRRIDGLLQFVDRERLQ